MGLLIVKLKRSNQADIFLHDSLHTYSHTMFEYIIVDKKFGDGGLLLSDDVKKY